MFKRAQKRKYPYTRDFKWQIIMRISHGGEFANTDGSGLLPLGVKNDISLLK